MRSGASAWALVAWAAASVVARPAAAAQVLHVNALRGSLDLAFVVETLEDPGAALELVDVEGARAGDFRALGNKVTHGYSDSAWWLRLDVDGGTDGGDFIIEFAYPQHDQVIAYVRTGDGLLRTQAAGIAVDSRSRLAPGEHVAFPIRLGAHESARIHLRVTSRALINLEARAWSADAWARHRHRAGVTYGLFYGALLAALLYHLVLSLTMKDSKHLHFALFLGGLTALGTVLEGLAHTYAWPGNAWWAHQAVPMFLVLTCAAALRFAQSFLETDERLADFHPRLRALYLAALACAGLVMVLPYRMATGLGLALLPIALVTGAWAGKLAMGKKVPYAGSYMVGMGTLSVLCVGVLAGTVVNVLESGVATFTLRVSACVIALLFSSALGRSIADLTGEKLRKEAEARVELQRLYEKLERLNAQLEDRVRDRTAELVALNQRKDDLVAAVSHDFRTPLSVIRQNAQTLRAELGSKLDEELREQLDAVIRQEARLTRMCENLLDLARIKDRGVTRAHLDLAEHVRDVADAMKDVAAGNGITWGVDVAGPAPVLGDAQRLEQVVQNLLDNACKFTPRGGRVDVSLSPADGKAHLVVRDTGPGIPAASLPRLFEPFYQVNAAANRGKGSGLGLAIVRVVAEAHGGTVHVTSEEGRGTTFTVALPLA